MNPTTSENKKKRRRKDLSSSLERRKVGKRENASDMNGDKTEKKGKIILPSKAEDMSVNWKKLSATFPKPKPKTEHIHYPRKKKKEINDKKEEIWFDGVDDILLESSTEEVRKEMEPFDPLVKANSFSGLTKIVAMDCEMVGVGSNGRESILARVSIVNHFGRCIYDKYVTPRETVTDYRTEVSGIRPKDLQNKGEDFKIVQKEVSDILKDRTLVGHAIRNDLKVLFLDHPRKRIRDTSRYKPFRRVFGGRNPSLKKLTEKLLGVRVQEGEHDSVQDAQAAMRLYTMHRKEWEKDVKEKRFQKRKPTNNKNNSKDDDDDDDE